MVSNRAISQPKHGLFTGSTVTVIFKMVGLLEHAMAGDEVVDRIAGDGIPHNTGCTG